MPLARRVTIPQPRGGAGPSQTDPARPRPHRTRRAAWSPPPYLLDVHVCEGWGRRPPRCLLPSLSPPSPSLPGTSARRDPRVAAASSRPVSLPRLPSAAPRSPLTQTKWRQSLPQPDPARTIQHPVEGEVWTRQRSPAPLEKEHRTEQQEDRFLSASKVPH